MRMSGVGQAGAAAAVGVATTLLQAGGLGGKGRCKGLEGAGKHTLEPVGRSPPHMRNCKLAVVVVVVAIFIGAAALPAAAG